jgi:hypothetical protein
LRNHLAGGEPGEVLLPRENMDYLELEGVRLAANINRLESIFQPNKEVETA